MSIGSEPAQTPPIPSVAPELEAFRNDSAARSDEVRRQFKNERGIAFGAHPRQVLDIYCPKQMSTSAPVFYFLHGGGFRGGSPGGVAYIGKALLDHGSIFVASSYRLAPEVTFPDMVEDVTLGLEWVYRNISSRGGNPDRIYLAGHSAGATAAGLVAFRTDWLAEQGLPEDLVQGVVLISGGYINRREGEEVNKASKYFVPDLSQAIAHLPPHSIIVTAEHDLPQCQPGAEALVVALKRKGASHEFISRVPGRDHFFVGHELADGGSIFAATREMMGLR